MHDNFYNHCCGRDCDCTIQKQKTQKIIKNRTKAYLIENGYFDLWRNVQKANYYHDSNLMELDDNIRSRYEKYLGQDIGLNSFQKKCCRQLFDSRRARVRRLKKRLEIIILNNDCIWLTLTFTDSVLENTSKETRRRYISRFLKSLNVPFYVAKIDFGDKDKNPYSNGREHYHAIVQSSKIDFSLYPYGIINGSRVRRDVKSLGKLSQYINKISYHFFKDSTGYNSLIYSRN